LVIIKFLLVVDIVKLRITCGLQFFKQNSSYLVDIVIKFEHIRALEGIMLLV